MSKLKRLHNQPLRAKGQVNEMKTYEYKPGQFISIDTEDDLTEAQAFEAAYDRGPYSQLYRGFGDNALNAEANLLSEIIIDNEREALFYEDLSVLGWTK